MSPFSSGHNILRPRLVCTKLRSYYVGSVALQVTRIIYELVMLTLLAFLSTRQDIKRQRTASGSPSNPSNPNTNSTSQNADSDDGSPSNKDDGNGGPKKIRGAAARNHREKETRDREAEREKARADAAGRRKGRAERRRGDGIELIILWP